MIELKDQEQRLEIYSDAIDYFMETGFFPDTLEDEDTLAVYMKRTLRGQPFIRESDKLWQDMLKMELLKFFKSLLEAMDNERRNNLQELADKQIYDQMDLDEKRQNWNELSTFLKQSYTPEEVNIDGYLQQFKINGRDAVLDSLMSDWEKAIGKKAKEMERHMLEANCRKWEQSIVNIGRTDYAGRKRIERYCYKFKALKEIIEIIGREEKADNEIMDNVIRKFLPQIACLHAHVEEVDNIYCGKDLRYMLPMEATIMADSEIDTLFYHHYASGQLLQLASLPKSEKYEKTKDNNNSRPRLQKGPIVVSIDTSGSMEGNAEMIAHSILMQLLFIALKQKRKCFVISYSVRAKYIELTKPENWMNVSRFMEERFSGGTDGEEMLRYSLDALNTKNFGMADVLIISDFSFPLPSEETQIRIQEEKSKGTKFYGLKIGSGYGNSYNILLDKIWNIS